MILSSSHKAIISASRPSSSLSPRRMWMASENRAFAFASASLALTTGAKIVCRSCVTTAYRGAKRRVGTAHFCGSSPDVGAAGQRHGTANVDRVTLPYPRSRKPGVPHPTRPTSYVGRPKQRTEVTARATACTSVAIVARAFFSRGGAPIACLLDERMACGMSSGWRQQVCWLVSRGAYYRHAGRHGAPSGQAG
eukprot:456339-Prymnesium_polylepis.2